MFRKLLALIALLLPCGAQAHWRTAESRHFIVYTEGSPASARAIATKLEKFGFVLRTVSNAKQPDSPVKVKIYMVRDAQAVENTMAFSPDGVAGYYHAVIRGPYAVMPRIGTGGDLGLGAQQVLFHELTHHFMFQYFPAAYPTWYSEGFADFYGSMQIGADDKVQIGMPVGNRYYSFAGNNWLPMKTLLTARSYDDVGPRLGELYSEGWLLVHYLSNAPARSGQLQTYLDAINAGVSFEDAAKRAFGDNLGKLDNELRAYGDNPSLPTMILPFKPIDVGKIEDHELGPAQDAMLRYDITLSSGVPVAETNSFADTVEKAAAAFPDDPYALQLRTEAERLAGRTAAANATVARWLQVAPDAPLALMHKAQLDLDALAAAKVTDPARWQAARKPLVTAARAAQDDPQILKAYYDSFVTQGVLPPDNAQNALIAAFDLLPQDGDMRYEVASDFEHRKMYCDAVAVIRPSAFQLHGDDDQNAKDKARAEKLKAHYRLAGDRDTETPREMLTRLEKELTDSGGKADCKFG